MRALSCLLAATAVLGAGCSGETAASDAALPAPAATVTVTAEPPAGSEGAGLDELVDQLDDQPTARAPRPPKLQLTVFSDGCGVIRSRPAPGTTYANLTWTVLDQGGFQVLGRNAEGETRYRYYQGGTYTILLEAFVDGAYRPVSNKVSVTC